MQGELTVMLSTQALLQPNRINQFLFLVVELSTGRILHWMEMGVRCLMIIFNLRESRISLGL